MICFKYQTICLISAMFLFQPSADAASSSLVFVNDQAAGTVAVMNANGKILSKIPLEQIGRGTYSGDDFIVKDNRFIFVNSVDKKLEYFDRATGKHIKSAVLPTGVLAGQTKRSNRIIDRIFLVDKAIFIGNGSLLFDLETGMKKSASPVAFLKSPGTARFSLLAGKKRFLTTGDFLTDPATGKKALLPASHFTINGKTLFILAGHVFSVIAAKEGISIVDCGLLIAE
jgi:hypothetical protein